MGNPGNRIDEGHGAVEVVETELLLDALPRRCQLPAGQQVQVLLDVGSGQCILRALARAAAAAGQFVKRHVRILQQKAKYKRLAQAPRCNHDEQGLE